MPHVELTKPNAGQEHLTDLILNACSDAAKSTVSKIHRRFAQPRNMLTISTLRDLSYRKVHFSHEAALRSRYTTGEVGDFDSIAVRKVHLPQEAMSNPKKRPDLNYLGRIIDLSFLAQPRPAEEKAWWEEMPLPFKDEERPRQRDYSLYVGRGLVPVLIDQEILNAALWSEPDLHNRFSAVHELTSRLLPKDVYYPDYNEMQDIYTSVHVATTYDQDLGETLLECISELDTGESNDRKTTASINWFQAAAHTMGVLYAHNVLTDMPSS